MSVIAHKSKSGLYFQTKHCEKLTLFRVNRFFKHFILNGSSHYTGVERTSQGQGDLHGLLFQCIICHLDPNLNVISYFVIFWNNNFQINLGR